MGTKQSEKSERTYLDLQKSAIDLFLEKGYENTSVSNITSKAGYSTGCFYKHWKSKSEIFMEFWNEYVSEYINESINKAPNDGDIEVMINYLIIRSDEFASSDITKKLYATSILLSSNYDYPDISKDAVNYRTMLYNFLKKNCSCDENQLSNIANIMHCILNAYTMRDLNILNTKYIFDSNTVRQTLLKIIDLCNPLC